METEAQRQERIDGKVSGGLDSLAAAASRGIENIGIEEDLDFKDERPEKASESKGQKGKARITSYAKSSQKYTRVSWCCGHDTTCLEANT